MVTALIVDDDPHICQLLCDLVEDLGHAALSATNGLAAHTTVFLMSAAFNDTRKADTAGEVTDFIESRST